VATGNSSLSSSWQVEKEEDRYFSTTIKVRRELPPFTKMMQELNSSTLFKASNFDHLSVQAKNDCTGILSSMHLSTNIATSRKRKPVLFYKQTGVDVPDDMARFGKVGARR